MEIYLRYIALRLHMCVLHVQLNFYIWSLKMQQFVFTHEFMSKSAAFYLLQTEGPGSIED